MELKKRIIDIQELRNHVCQEYLGLIISSGWQTQLFNYIKYLKEHPRDKTNKNESFNQFSSIYNNMRRYSSLEDFTVYDLDIIAIRAIISSRENIVDVDRNIRRSLFSLSDRRNEDYGHLNSNETILQLIVYLSNALDDILKFVDIVDIYEKRIDDSAKHQLKAKYYEKTKYLQKTIFAEYSEFSRIERKVEFLLKEDESRQYPEWQKLYDEYWDYVRAANQKRPSYYTKEMFDYFILKSYEADLDYSYGYALDYYEDHGEYTKAKKVLKKAAEKYNPDKRHFSPISLGLLLHSLNKFIYIEKGVKKDTQEIIDILFPYIQKSIDGFYEPKQD